MSASNHEIENLLRQITGRLGIAQPASEAAPSESAADVIVLRNGRYSAANPQFQADLRLDTEQTAIVSMDIFQGVGPTRTWLASLRSNPGDRIGRSQSRFGVIGEDEDGNRTTGMMELRPLSETQATVSVTLNQGLNGLPVNVPFVLSAAWQSAFLRTVGLEVDQEDSVPALPQVDFRGRLVTVESSFRDAGIEMIAAGTRDAIPRPAQPWDDSQLHGLMVRFANESINRREWALHLLLLSSHQMSGLLGVMFDSGQHDENGLPRQGAAIFVDPIRSHPAGFERKLIQTTVHELGHALNLAHRFERSVSRADSISFMNYDWRFLGGNRSEQFWLDFAYQFDPDEIRFLRHAPLASLIPGDAEFHTVNYWSDGTGGYSPYVPEVRLQGLDLALRAPAGGPLFDFAQPVLLTIELKNVSGRTLNLPIEILDPKSGFLEILVRRLGTRRRRLPEDTITFSPIITRCWDAQPGLSDQVPSGGVMTNNVNLTFGSAGFTFAEPGSYELTAVLALFDRTNQVDQVVRSNPLRIRIAHPGSREEEHDAIELFRRDVGYYLALGGSDVLNEAAETLEAIRERRQGKAKAISDPLVANIIRTQAINDSRDFVTYDRGKFHTRDAKPARAVDLLTQLEKDAKQYFDLATQKNNNALLEKMKKQSKKK